jgi:hypothetical protein
VLSTNDELGVSMKYAMLTVLLAALTVAAAAAGAQQPRPQITLLAQAHSFTAVGLGNVHAGYTDITVRDVSKVTHGAGLIRLDDPGMTAAKAAKIIGGDNIPAHLGFTLFGGVAQLSPGQSWHATLRLTPGRYVFFDDGDNGKGMVKTFTVGARTAQTTPPRTVGTIVMRDFAFGIHLPARWNGRGMLRVPNVGKEIHELTFIPMKSKAEARKWSGILSKGYPSGPPPAGVTFAVGGMSPGQTTWVSVQLERGLYLAVCLFPDPKTHKPHTALGMLSTVTVY